MRACAQPLARVREEGHAQQPVVVHRDGAERVGGELLESGSGGILAPQVALEQHQRAREHEPGRILGDGLPERRLDLLETRLRAPQQEELEPRREDRIPGHRVPSELERALDQLLGPVELPREQRQVGARGGDVPELRGLSQILGEQIQRRKLGVDPLELSQVEQRDEPVRAALKRPLPVVEVAGELDDLVCDAQPLFGIARPEDRRAVSVERIGERRRVAQPPGHLHALGAQCGARVGQPFVAQGTGEAREEAHAQRTVLLWQAGERVAQEGDEARIVTRPRPHDPPAVADGCLCERLGQLAPPRDLGRLEKGFLRVGHVAGPRLGVAQRQQ